MNWKINFKTSPHQCEGRALCTVCIVRDICAGQSTGQASVRWPRDSKHLALSHDLWHWPWPLSLALTATIRQLQLQTFPAVETSTFVAANTDLTLPAYTCSDNFCIHKICIVFRRNQPNSASSRHLAHLQLQIRRVSKPQVCSVACASVGRRTNVRLCCPCRGDSAAAQRALGFATLKVILSLQDAHAQLQAQSCMQLQTCIAARNSCSCNSWFVATTVSDTDRSPRRRLITAASHILSPDVSQLKSFYSEIVRNSAKKHVDLEKAFASHHCD